MAAAKRTWATCSSKMARPSFQTTATPCKSSTRLVRPMWRIRNSRLLRSMNPPPALAAKPRSACSTCVSVTPELGHAWGIGLHPQLANFASYGNGLGHPWNRQQTRAQHKIRILAGLHGGCYGVFAIAFGQGQRNQHDLAHDRRHRPHDRGDPARELFAHQGQSLGDELTIAINVGTPVELGVQNRKADA